MFVFFSLEPVRAPNKKVIWTPRTSEILLAWLYPRPPSWHAAQGAGPELSVAGHGLRTLLSTLVPRAANPVTVYTEALQRRTASCETCMTSWRASVLHFEFYS